MDLLRLILDARRISPITATNAITIKDTPEHISAAAKVLSAIDKARPEVVIDVELLEIDRTKLLEYGLQIASPGSPGLNGSATINPADDHAAGAQEPVAVRHPADEPAGHLLSPAQDRHEHARAGEPAAAHVGRHHRDGAVRRSRAGAGHDVRAHRHGRHAAAAHHLVSVRERRREHRHHAAHASRRRRHAAAEHRDHEHFGNGIRRAADVRQSRDQDGDSAARRRNQPAGGPHPRRRAPHHGRDSRTERPAARRPDVLALPAPDGADRHRPDADAAHRPRARSERVRSPAVQGRPRNRDAGGPPGADPVLQPPEPAAPAPRRAAAGAPAAATPGPILPPR